MFGPLKRLRGEKKSPGEQEPSILPHQNPAEYNRRSLIRLGTLSFGFVGTWLTVDHAADRALEVKDGYDETIGTALPVVEKAIGSLASVQAACADVQPHLKDLEDARQALIDVAAVLKPKKKHKKTPDSSVPPTSTTPITSIIPIESTTTSTQPMPIQFASPPFTEPEK